MPELTFFTREPARRVFVAEIALRNAEGGAIGELEAASNRPQDRIE